MDIFTHILTGTILWKSIDGQSTEHLIISIIISIMPDIGEIPIQFALRKKYNSFSFVYDNRTSDVSVSKTLSITWLYDLMHSAVLPFLIILYYFIINNDSMIILLIGFNWLAHIFWDSFTHGKIWALKLFFPIINTRFPIYAKQIGNWWEWKPIIKIKSISIPFLLVGFWCFLTFWLYYLW